MAPAADVRHWGLGRAGGVTETPGDLLRAQAAVGSQLLFEGF